MKPSTRAHSLLTLLRTTALRLLRQWSQWRRASRAPALIPIRIDSVRRERPGGRRRYQGCCRHAGVSRPCSPPPRGRTRHCNHQHAPKE